MSYYMYLSITGEQKIAIYAMDEDTGGLTFQEDVPAGQGVMPLVADSAQQYFYAGLRGAPEVRSYRLDGATGKISQIGVTPLDWDTTYMALDRTDRYLLSASYGRGVVGVHAVGDDGIVREGSVDRHETGRCAHYVQTDHSNQFAFVPHVAETNTIYQYIFDDSAGSLTPNDPPTVPQPPDTGPRHYCHHPEKNFVYADNEQGCSVTAYHFDPEDGTLESFQTVSTLPDDFTDENTCAQIHIHPTGRFLYASNRGHDSIACFSINQETGLLNVIGRTPAPGTPRAFNLDPEGRFLFAAGQADGKLGAYRIDRKTGALTPLTEYDVGASPSWVMILKL